MPSANKAFFLWSSRSAVVRKMARLHKPLSILSCHKKWSVPCLQNPACSGYTRLFHWHKQHFITIGTVLYTLPKLVNPQLSSSPDHTYIHNHIFRHFITSYLVSKLQVNQKGQTFLGIYILTVLSASSLSSSTCTFWAMHTHTHLHVSSIQESNLPIF